MSAAAVHVESTSTNPLSSVCLFSHLNELDHGASAISPNTIQSSESLAHDHGAGSLPAKPHTAAEQFAGPDAGASIWRLRCQLLVSMREIWEEQAGTSVKVNFVFNLKTLECAKFRKKIKKKIRKKYR